MGALKYQVLNASSKLTDRIRARGALDVNEPTATDFTGFHGVRQALVVTFKKSGEAVPSPMNFGLDDDQTLYFRTDASLGKVKRIRNNPRVLVVPSGLRGQPRGAVVETTARILPADEHEHATRVLKANYSKAMALLEGGFDTTSNQFDMPWAYIELTPTGGGVSEETS